MTQQKKLKKTIRARARKTGESYAAARRQVLAARERRGSPSTASAPDRAAAPRPAAKAAPRGEAGVLRKTGHGYDHWFAVLDAFDARAKGHTAAARHLYEGHGVPGWHCQMITVEYERARGLRATNQACTGDFQVSVSRVVPATVATVAEAFADPRRRSAWLQDADPSLRKALQAALSGPKAKLVTVRDPRNARFRFKWDGSTVEVRIAGKPKGTGASVAVDNTGLADAGAVERRRALWRPALDALRQHLGR